MKKILVLLLTFLFASFALAETEAAAATTSIFSTPGFSMALAAGLCGLGQGRATSAACEGIARNPGAAGNIRTTLIIGLVLIESLSLYTLVIVFVKG